VVVGLGDRSILFGHPVHGLASAQSFFAPGALMDVVLRDIDDDGALDAVAASTSGEIAVFPGNRDGTFAAPTTDTVGPSPTALVVEDFDADGLLDVASANASGTVSVLLATAPGVFAPEESYVVGSEPVALTAADFDGDGVLDLAVADYLAPTVSVLIGVGDGSFALADELDTFVDRSYAVVAGDMNGDGAPDLLVGGRTDDIALYLNDGVGAFGAPLAIANGENADSLVVADFDQDGNLDFAAGGGSLVTVYFGAGDGTFVAQEAISPGASAHDLIALDLDSDGALDLVAVDNFRDEMRVLVQTTGGFVLTTQESYPTELQVMALANGDLDDDGVDELVLASFSDHCISVVRRGER
jgi:hypothetical protein